jgi:hypothetical protein
MQNLAAPLLAATAAAIALKDPKFDDFYKNFETAHFVKNSELNAFNTKAKSEISIHDTA